MSKEPSVKQDTFAKNLRWSLRSKREMVMRLLRGGLHLKKMQLVMIAGACMIAVAVGFTLLFRSSWTKDRYICPSCKSFGQSTAFRIFRFSIIRTPIRTIQSVGETKCDHQWKWYFANSHGICFNSRDNWDGPIGTNPYQLTF